MVAMGIAMRLKGGTPGMPPPGATGRVAGTASQQGTNNSPGAGNETGGQGQGQGGWRGPGSAGGASGMPGGPRGNWRGSGGAPLFFDKCCPPPSQGVNPN